MFLKRLFYVLIITSTTFVQADDLTPLEVESSLLSNTVGESKYPLAIIGSTDINSTPVSYTHLTLPTILLV